LQRTIPTHLFQRIQLNFHGQFHRYHERFFDLAMEDGRTFILQCDGVNDSGARHLIEKGEGRIVPLFDSSGGAGALPPTWPTAWPGIVCGYAGGLGPDSIDEQLPRIRAASNGERFWIDMERRVRSQDDSVFALAKVETVLKAVYGRG
jgi:hypothetical protein